MQTVEGAKRGWTTRRKNKSNHWEPARYEYKSTPGRDRDEKCAEASDRPGFWRTSIAFSIKEKEKYTQLVDYLVTGGSNFHEWLIGEIEEELAKREKREKVILE